MRESGIMVVLFVNHKQECNQEGCCHKLDEQQSQFPHMTRFAEVPERCCHRNMLENVSRNQTGNEKDNHTDTEYQ